MLVLCLRSLGCCGTDDKQYARAKAPESHPESMAASKQLDHFNSKLHGNTFEASVVSLASGHGRVCPCKCHKQRFAQFSVIFAAMSPLFTVLLAPTPFRQELVDLVHKLISVIRATPTTTANTWFSKAGHEMLHALEGGRTPMPGRCE